MSVRFDDVYDRVTRPESRVFKPYSIAQGDGFARMHQNECYLEDRMRSSLVSELTDVVRAAWSGQSGPHVYPDLVSLALRTAYAAYLGLTTQEVEVFSGSSEALYTIAAGCFKPSASVAFLNPSFSLLTELVQLWGACHVPIALNDDLTVVRESLFSHDVLESDVVILCEPNNPTGTSIRHAWIEEFLNRARGLVVVDEAYFEFLKARDESCVSFVEQLSSRDNLVVLRTLSKAWGAAGLRVGALASCPRWVNFFSGLRRPYSIPQPSEIMGTHLLNTKQHMMRRLVADSVYACGVIASELVKIKGVHVFPSATNFVFFRTKTAANIARMAIDEKILVRQVGADLIRVSPWDAQTNRRFVEIVRKAVEG